MEISFQKLKKLQNKPESNMLNEQGQNPVGTNIDIPTSVSNKLTVISEGIDISAFQKTINWKEVANSGIKFCIIKATEGTTNVNLKQDVDQTKGAIGVGIQVGYYHYAKYKDPAQEATAFVNAVNEIEKQSGAKSSFPLVLDIEDPIKTLNKVQFDNWVLKFYEIIKSAGRELWLYSYTPYLNSMTNGGLTHIPLWVAAYRSSNVINHADVRPPKLPKGWNHWTAYNSPSKPKGSVICWQYTGSGTVKGIAGKVDRNVFLK